MHPFVARSLAAVRSGFTSAAAKAAKLDRRQLAWGGLVLAGITFLSVNLIAAIAFRSARVDLTKEGLYTISEGTRKALASIDEPIDVRVYFSKKLGELAPTYAKNFERVRTLLGQYRSISGNKLKVAYLEPEPFSEAEDRAVAAGLQGIRLNQEGEVGYFGLAATNSTDNEGTIAFFAPERERFIEYDVTKLIYTLANPKKRVVGLLSSLPLEGGLDPMMGMRGRPVRPQLVMEQIRDVFDVKTLEKDVKEIPRDIDVLMIVQPDGLTPQSVYAIDQFALAGGKVLAFVDPVAETQRAGPMGPGGPPKLGDFDKLLKAWGVTYDPAKVAGDIAHARRVQFGGGLRATVTEYVAWLGLDRSSLDERDVLSGGIERVNLASSGFLTKIDNATTNVTPILQTSPDAMQIAADKVSMMPDAVGLLRDYKPEGRPLMLAARISGEAKSAYPDGPPKSEARADGGGTAAADKASDQIESPAGQSPPAGSSADQPPAAAPTAEGEARHAAGGRVNAVIIADTDLLNDQFWVDIRDFLGQQVAVPHAHNAAFVVGALENLSGSDALLSLRGRGVTDRPFDLVNAIRRDAERRFREKEMALTAKLKDMQEQLTKLERAGEGESVILSEKDRQAIEKFRSEMLTVRRELRDVKLALRRDIDRLDSWLKFANIGAVPLLIGIGGIGLAAWRRRRKAI
jgi:ABC-type uncharacterized transport system involved in gliding motility auxiliary subunit